MLKNVFPSVSAAIKARAKIRMFEKKRLIEITMLYCFCIMRSEQRWAYVLVNSTEELEVINSLELSETFKLYEQI